MSLKEKWVDKVDGVDVNSADHINQVANAVIELEENAVMTEELNEKINEALQEAKEGGDFNGEDGKSAYAYAQDGGYTGTEAEFAKKLAKGYPNTSVTEYGAKGDGTTDDTVAFQNALAANRTVFVPGGTYKLTSGITIGDNCCLELAQDAVLNFTNTSGNCITLGMLSHLKGNHATVKVPYAFGGNVIYANSNDHTDAESRAVPPFTKWSPQWKSGRYVTDLNICKADSRGFHYAVEPTDCKGVAVYLSADNTAGLLGFMWGIHFSGLRIAGAFSYGIRAVNFDDGWMHEMRIDAFIDACEIGVSLEDCNNAYVSAIIQPRCAYTMDEVYKPYAKHGIQLIRSKNADLSGSRVWDWDAERTLWTDGGEYQHIAMIGECRGAIINDFYYYETSTDIRKQIYTDTPSNLEQMNILQEPFTRWFKPKDGEPHFFDGYTTRRLAMKDDIDEYFQTDRAQAYTDVKSPYQDGMCDYNGTLSAREGNLYIEPKSFAVGDVVRIRGIDFASNWPGQARAYLYVKSTGAYKGAVNIASEIEQKGNVGKFYNDEATFVWDAETSTMTITFDGANAASYTNTYEYAFGGGYANGYTADNVIMTINEEIKYIQTGFLADGIKVKGENVIGGVGGGAGGSGGTSIDVTAEVGQTIIVKEVDANGKPTKWESAEYQPRTHWEEEGVLFSGTFDAATIQEGVPVDFTLVDGKTYTVMWNGVEYSCPVRYMPTDEGINLPALGNVDLLLETGDTGEPFLFVYLNHTLIDLCISEYTTVELSITGEKINAIPQRYLTNSYPYYIEITGSGTDDDPYVCNDTITNVRTIYDSGREIKLRLRSFSDAGAFYTIIYNLISVLQGCVELIFVSAGMGDMSNGYFILVGTEGDTYTVRSSLD